MNSRIALAVLLCSGMVGQAGPTHGSGALKQLQTMSEGFADVAARTTPGVVAISTERVAVVHRNNPFRGTPWGPRFNMPDSTEQRRQGTGSGVIVEHDGDHYVLTNNHVVEGAKSIRVELTDARHFEAEVVGADTLSDLAVLEIDADDLPAVPWGTSADLRVGEWVLAIGNPFGLEHSVSAGIVSAMGRDRTPRPRGRLTDYGSFIQTDAAINPGNSGGPLVNLEGELVGINTSIISNAYDPGNKGIGFAIPVDLALNVLGQLVEHGEVRRGLLGAHIRDLSPMLAEAVGLESTNGVLIAELTPDGPAERAGLLPGDVILTMDGEEMRTVTELRSRVGATAPGTEVTIRLVREGEKKEVDVELGQLSESAFAAAPAAESEPEATGSLGLRLRNLTPEDAEKYGYEAETGVLIAQVRRGSQAGRAGLRPGDVIVNIAYKQVTSIDDYERIVGDFESDKAVLFEIRRGSDTNFVPLKMP